MVSRRSFLAAVAVTSSGCSRLRRTGTVSPCERDSGGWSRFQNDVHNSGAYPGTVPASGFTVDAIQRVDDRRGGIVTGPGGTVFFGSAETLFSYDSRGREKQWSKRLDSEIDTTPSVYCGTVFVATGSTVYALDASDGARRWKRELGSIATPPLVLDGTVFVATLGTVYALRVRDGSTRWEFGGEGATETGICAGPGTLFLTTEGGPSAIRALDPATGEEAWSTPVESGIAAPPTFDRAAVFATDEAGNAYRVNAENGEITWKRPAVSSRAPTPAATGDRVVVPSGNGDESKCLDRADGELLWSLSTGPVLSPPVVTTERVLVGTMNSGVFVVSKEGEVIDHFEAVNAGSPMALTPRGLFFKTRFPDPEAVRVH